MRILLVKIFSPCFIVLDKQEEMKMKEVDRKYKYKEIETEIRLFS